MTTVFSSAVEFDGSVAFDGAVDLDGATDLTGAHVSLGTRTIAADGALAITGADRVVVLLSSTTGTKAATITAPTAIATGGPLLTIVLKARSGGAYTVACTNAATTGTVTFDAADEAATFCWINGTLHLITLTGATFA